MRLYILRHGKAGERTTWEGDDALRPLTNGGRTHATRMLTALMPLVTAHEVLTSPWLRARQTAEIASAIWRLPLREVAWLAGGAASVEERAERLGHLHDAVLVGHEPDLGLLVGFLAGGRITLKKCGLVILDGEPRQGGMTVMGLLQPKVVFGLAR